MDQTAPSQAPSSLATHTVLVTGDVVVDHHIYVSQRHRAGSTMRLGMVEQSVGGGAALLHRLLAALAVPETPPAGSPPAAGQVSATVRPLDARLGVQDPMSGHLPPGLHGYAVFQPCPPSTSGGPGAKIWRMREALGFGTEPSSRHVPAAVSEALGRDCEVAVIDDAGLGFRVQTARNAWPPAVHVSGAPWPDWLVLKLSAPVASGDLWRAIVAATSGSERLQDRCVVVVSINELRAEGAQVPPALSWERTALDLAEELGANPRLRGLGDCRYVIVTLDTDGALLADFSERDRPVFRLVFDPACLEGDWADGIPGKIVGLQTCLAAAVTHRLPARTAPPEEVRQGLEQGIQAGLAAMRRLLTDGHGAVTASEPGFPFAAVSGEIRQPTWRYSVATLPEPGPHRQHWTILEGDASAHARQVPLFGTARRVALRGAAELRRVPYQRLGKLFVIERGEIERLRSLRRLARDYAGDAEASRPLSIAVFGPPGAGKSFGVKEIARSVLGEKTPILEFNLAQMADPSTLIGWLHQVRDKVLEGHLPVVFWDEFDSQDLHWLQYLLAPMQDGKFQHGDLAHPTGRCIFVFAGGTKPDFQSFAVAPPEDDAPEAEKKRWETFKKQKGPDFVSRLAGYLDVLGPNQRQRRDARTGKEHPDPADVSYPIRRALFLRTKLTKGPDDVLAIDPGVLTALLEVGVYRHGSRSLEKVLDHLRQSSGTGEIRRSDLPPAHLLALQVDDREFMRLVERDLGFKGDVEAMAQAYHEFYRALACREGWTVTYDGPYGEVPEDIKGDNRAAARRIPEVLALAGLYLVKDASPVSSPEQEEIRAVLERNLEILAAAEHQGWMDHKQRESWLHGARKDAERVHDLLARYEELPAKEQAKDRDAVRHYPEIAGSQGYRIVLEPPAAE